MGMDDLAHLCVVHVFSGVPTWGLHLMPVGVKLGKNVEEDETVRIIIWKKLEKVCSFQY
jgi:hypothetical protein